MRAPPVLLTFGLLLVGVLAASGCLTPSDTTTPASLGGSSALNTSWAANILMGDKNPNGTDHSHRDWAQHVGLSTPNFQELGWDPLAVKADGNQSVGGYFCGGSATTKEGKRISVISSFDTDVAFVVVDTTDPAHPIHLGDYMLGGPNDGQGGVSTAGIKYDVDVTPDGKHVILGQIVPLNALPGSGAAGALDSTTSKLGLNAAAPASTFTVQPKFRDACTGEVRNEGPEQKLPLWPATVMISLADPKNPAFEDAFPAPVVGPHSVSSAIIDNVTYVAASTTNLVHQGSYFQFFMVQELPTGGKLVPLSLVDSGQYGNLGAVSNGHVDAEIAMHPILKKPVVYLSDWDGGLIVLDFSVPAAPVRLGEWQDTGAQGGAFHSTRSIDGVYNGRHYLLAGQEFVAHPVNRPSGWIYILDDTDPANIKEVGRWTLPVDTPKPWAKGSVELYSTHYFRVLNDTVFVAMYHAGVWAFKLNFTDPTQMKEPLSVGAFVPDKYPEHPRPITSGYNNGGYNYAPFVLDVFPYEDNNLVVYDGLSGVYSVHYDPDHPMPSPKPWPASGITAS